MACHGNLYKHAKYYDIAFDFKDVPKECDFIAAAYSKINCRNPMSFLELGAGPAVFAIEFAKRGSRSAALDISPEMVAYGCIKACEASVPLTYICADMTTYRLEERYDVVALLMDSSSYLLDNEAVYRHLESVALSLNPGGIYVLEMEHPRRVFAAGRMESIGWASEREGISVRCEWGQVGDLFDPITQIAQVTAKFEYIDGEERGVIVETAPQRCFTANEFKALVDASGLFRIENIYGAMDNTVPFDNEKRSWRMVPILAKV